MRKIRLQEQNLQRRLPCRFAFNQEKGCKKGKACNFSHNPNDFKGVACPFLEKKGHCKFIETSCRYAHVRGPTSSQTIPSVSPLLPGGRESSGTTATGQARQQGSETTPALRATGQQAEQTEEKPAGGANEASIETIDGTTAPTTTTTGPPVEDHPDTQNLHVTLQVPDAAEEEEEEPSETTTFGLYEPRS